MFKHAYRGMDDVYDVWASDPLFYEADHLPAHWLMVAEVSGAVLVVRSHRRPLEIRRSAAQSAVTRPPSDKPPHTGGIAMTTEMTPDEEYEFYAKPENRELRGEPRRRKARLTAPIPVRFPEATMDEIRKRAEADDRSVSSWIRRAVEHELNRSA